MRADERAWSGFTRAGRRSLALVRTAARVELRRALVLQATASACLVGQLLLVRHVLQVLISAPHVGHGLAGLAPTLVGLGVLTAIGTLATTLCFERQRVMVELVKKHAMERILAVTTTVDLAEFERPDFNDELARVRNDALTRPVTLVTGLLAVAQSLLTATGLVATLAVVAPIMLAVVAVGVVPMILLQRRSSRELHAAERALTTTDRRRAYLEGVLSTLSGAKETRAFRLASLLGPMQRQLADDRITAVDAVVRRRSLRAAAIAVIGAAVFAGGLALLVWLVVRGRLSTASAATTALVVQQLTIALRTAAVGGAQIYENSLFLADVNDFMARAAHVQDYTATADESGAAPVTLAVGLQVTGLDFSYPGTDHPVLHGITLTVRAGSVVAIVGENGSGKTTLAKVLTGLYAPTRGSVRWDDIEAMDTPRIEWQRRFAVVFQDFVRYELSARVNIALGRPEALHDDDAVRTAAAVADADAFLARIGGYDTVLSRAYEGGADLSIGQWQRIALARAFFCEAPVLVLDEPTSALDPRVEHELLEKVRANTSDRTVVLISHRLSSVRYADRIFVLRDGALVEEGTHEDLLARGGHYFDLFSVQARAYADAAS